jgi:hypothetical protein
MLPVVREDVELVGGQLDAILIVGRALAPGVGVVVGRGRGRRHERHADPLVEGDRDRGHASAARDRDRPADRAVDEDRRVGRSSLYSSSSASPPSATARSSPRASRSGIPATASATKLGSIVDVTRRVGRSRTSTWNGERDG